MIMKYRLYHHKNNSKLQSKNSAALSILLKDNKLNEKWDIVMI